MINYKKVAAQAAMVSMLLTQTAPAVFATELVITGNGSQSDSDIKVSNTNTTSVIQDNTTKIDNKINLTGNTGGNNNDGNTGGDSIIKTGDATAVVNVSNMGNTNSAVVDNCDCDSGTDVLIEGNGTKSENNVRVAQQNATALFQTNTLDLDNDVKVNLNTGDNVNDDNTGGLTKTTTGDAVAVVDILNTANANSAVVSGGGVGNVGVGILGNGKASLNNVALDLLSTNVLTQANNTKIDNEVGVKLNTGDNSASDNTGDDVAIHTGDAGAEILVANAAGFNEAYFANCGCDDTLIAKVKGNGVRSENVIRASVVDAQDVFQNNSCGSMSHGMLSMYRGHGGECFDNEINAYGNTGDNASDDNTGYEGSDPYTHTGDSFLHAAVDNMAGANTYGSGSGYDMPSAWTNGGANVNVSVDFNLGDLLAALMGL